MTNNTISSNNHYEYYYYYLVEVQYRAGRALWWWPRFSGTFRNSSGDSCGWRSGVGEVAHSCQLFRAGARNVTLVGKCYKWLLYSLTSNVLVGL